MKTLCPLAIIMIALLSSARSVPEYFNPEQMKQIESFPQILVVAKQLPQGYRLKNFSLKNTPQRPEYQVDFRCFCAGQNYSISILGRTQPFDLALATAIEEVQSPLGVLKLGDYPAIPAQGFKAPFNMTHWFGSKTFRYTVVTGLTGKPAPRQDLIFLLKHLEYIHVTA